MYIVYICKYIYIFFYFVLRPESHSFFIPASSGRCLCLDPECSELLCKCRIGPCILSLHSTESAVRPLHCPDREIFYCAAVLRASFRLLAAAVRAEENLAGAVAKTMAKFRNSDISRTLMVRFVFS